MSSNQSCKHGVASPVQHSTGLYCGFGWCQELKNIVYFSEVGGGVGFTGSKNVGVEVSSVLPFLDLMATSCCLCLEDCVLGYAC